MIYLKFNTVNGRLMIDLFGLHHVETADDEQMRNSAKFWKLSAQKVLEVARLVFFPCLWRGVCAKWRINRHSRQHRKTKVSELYSSNCHKADFGDEM